jgi:FMN phosphatase YigB (HAD superfamily)
MALTLEQYATYLDTRPDLAWPAAPEVVAAKAKPYLVRLPDVRAVTWGVYGTLLAVAGGDLLFEHPKPLIMDLALDKTIQEFNMWASMTRKAGKPSDYLRQIYLELLRAPALGSVKNPETCVERVWEAVVKKLLQKDYKFDAGFFGALNEYSAKIAYFFHASMQGTGCYPAAAATLRRLAAAGVVQGLIADAQCFTTVQLQRGLRQQDPAADLDELIEPGLRALSHKVGVKKPSEALFRQVVAALRERDIAPEEVLHVGASVELDVVPAKRLGLRTALFAGDAAALQATAEQLKTPASRPDILLTRLDQIPVVVPGASA